MSQHAEYERPNVRTWKVGYTVLSGVDNYATVVASGTVEVKATDEDEAAAEAYEWVENNDPHHDPRIDPCIVIDHATLVGELFCPQCGSPDSLYITVKVQAKVIENTAENIQTEVTGDHEWDDDSTAACGACGWTGKVLNLDPGRISMTTPDTDPVRAEMLATIAEYDDADLEREIVFADGFGPDAAETAPLWIELLHAERDRRAALSGQESA